jgi:hypothetical protein
MVEMAANTLAAMLHLRINAGAGGVALSHGRRANGGKQNNCNTIRTQCHKQGAEGLFMLLLCLRSDKKIHVALRVVFISGISRASSAIVTASFRRGCCVSAPLFV